ncbi:hypothetical protein [Nitrobacter sp. JJSN]|uniref:hypothetical protein n=1 Tax=Nitrobacter sp. JJSN TaxID=3453033 RepID=UPI003F76BFDA
MTSIEGDQVQELTRFDGIMDIEFLKQQAERCRRLLKGTDPFTEKRLLKLAEEYEARIKELEKRNSEPWSH